ncbi:MAG: hypothetical protein KR126chlam6_00218 [Candidatus Anoxychlamydiales bacterium]|nr:hypothetical protein [Candidatus Anoxychlamydiales bacterium]
MKRIIIIALISAFFSLNANEKNIEKKEEAKYLPTYYLEADIDFSPYIGAENLLTFHESIEKFLNWSLPIKPEMKFLYVSARLLEMFLFWQPLSELELVVQHEVFGHGYRIRDIGSSRVKVRKYKIDLPQPYGKGGGATNYNFNSDLTSFQVTAISSAGVEATAILANRIKMKWALSLRVDPKKSILYFQAQHDLTNYVLSMDNSIFFADTGHDIEGYLIWLNNTYTDDNLTKSDLKIASLINFVDPTTYYTIGAFFYYIFTGKDISFPMIKIKDVRFLPNLRLGLTPFGPEYYLENFMSYKNRAIYSYFRAGKHNNNTYFGLGFEYPNLYKFNLNTLGFRADIFYQPKIFSKSALFIFDNVQVGYSETDLNKMRFGISSYLIYDRKFSKKHEISFFSEVGYKSNGYVAGFSLKKGLIFRLGIGLGSF